MSGPALSGMIPTYCSFIWPLESSELQAGCYLEGAPQAEEAPAAVGTYCWIGNWARELAQDAEQEQQRTSPQTARILREVQLNRK